MCDYQGREFGASYLDSVCIDGYLWDADSGSGGMMDFGGDIPCPECNHAEWMERLHENIEEDGWIAARKGLSAEHNPFLPTFSTLKYPMDAYQFREWWKNGFDEYHANAGKEGGE